MRTIEWTGQFKRDYRRESKGQHRAMTRWQGDVKPTFSWKSGHERCNNRRDEVTLRKTQCVIP